MMAKGPFTLIAVFAVVAVIVYAFNFAVSAFYNAYSQLGAGAEVDKRAQQVAPVLQLAVNAIATAAVLVAAIIGYKQIRSQA
ncbi:MAG: hypothetical protein QXI07_09605 [Pyrobaculum sp.]